MASFKPCYKWNTFNTSANSFLTSINSPGFKPCYKWNTFNTAMKLNNAINTAVLNLVISGIPSIHKMRILLSIRGKRFKPCYKWNTFNTIVITIDKDLDGSFKPCYKWNTFNT